MAVVDTVHVHALEVAVGIVAVFVGVAADIGNDVVVVVVVVESQTGRSWGWLCSEGGRYTRVQQE